jgi:hypothetical protein
MKVIVSSRFSVDVVDMVNSDFVTVRTSDHDFHYYGITWNDEYMFLSKVKMDDSYTSFIDILDENLEYVDTISPVGLFDAHQIIYHDDKLWATSTRTNSIAIIDSDWNVKHWYPIPKFAGSDVSHFNSIWFDEYMVYIVAHNNNVSAVHVFFYPSLEPVAVINAGLDAHNVYVHNDCIVTLSSGEGIGVSNEPKTYNLPENNFPRGLSVGHSYAIVGLSENVFDREERHRERKGAIQYYNGFIDNHIVTYNIDRGMIYEIRGLDYPDRAHHGRPWTGRLGVNYGKQRDSSAHTAHLAFA